jgi:hypothetical protein
MEARVAAQTGGYLRPMTEAPALQIETRDELVSLLHEAAELEHGLVCSYLFTAFTLKEDGAELTGQQAEAVTRWRRLLTSVALEEMLHLALVSNLLTALGAAPHLRRPAFPQTSRYYPGGITIELRRFSDATITRFIHLERPEGVDVEEEVLSDPAVDVDADAPEVAPGALWAPDDEVEEVPTEAFSTVGHLYQAIEDGFCRLVEQRGEDAVFIGPPRAQATATDFQLPDLVAVTDLESARRAVEVLVVQGEGVRGDWTEAHYGKFLRVRQELRTLSADDEDFDPSRPVLANPTVHASVAGADGRQVEDPIAGAVMALCNGSYELMTAMLLRFFSHTDESEDALSTLVQSALGLMSGSIRPLGSLLTTLPAGAGRGDVTAGPSFEFSRSISLIPHRRAAWLVFHERLVELATFAHRIAEDGGPDVLVQIGEGLTATARDLEPHLGGAPIKPTSSTTSSRPPA